MNEQVRQEKCGGGGHDGGGDMEGAAVKGTEFIRGKKAK